MIILASIAAPVMAFLLFPVLAVVIISFSSGRFLEFPPPGFSLQWYRNFFQDPDWWGSTITSFRVAPITMVLATVLGTTVAFPLARSRFIGKNLLLIVIFAALIVPSIVKATSLYLLYAKLNLIGSVPALAVAHTVSALPFVVITVAASLRNFDIDLERAAQISGASPVESILRVTVPVISPAILAGALLAFLASFQELLISMFLLGFTRITLPVKMWNSVATHLDPTIPAASTMLIMMTVLAFITSNVVASRMRRVVGSAHPRDVS